QGQRVEIVQRGSGIDPDLIVPRADGRHFAVALSSTDSDPLCDGHPTPAANHLLELAGLRQARCVSRSLSAADPDANPRAPAANGIARWRLQDHQRVILLGSS